jgi:hypothetical protein
VHDLLVGNSEIACLCDGQDGLVKVGIG